MKKILFFILTLIIFAGVFAGCNTQKENEATEPKENIVYPLPETLDINTLDNCTASVSLEKGDAYVDESGKKMMKVKAYAYELYDMADIASLEENDIIVRRNEEITITELERLESGLVIINGGEENGGFDLISNDDNVYYQVGMNDVKFYYELGEAVLPISDEFEYSDESMPDEETKLYSAQDFLAENSEIEYNFIPNNTSIVIENGSIIKMTKTYMP